MSYGDSGGNNLLRIGIGLVVALVAAGVFAVSSCQRGPFGRKQLVRLKPDEEVKLGLQAYQEVLGEAKAKGAVLSGGPVVRAVKQVTRRLTESTKDKRFLELTKLPERDFPWEVSVVQSKEVNAFCLPGGKMVVYTAILPVCKNDAGLATVMGHDI